MSPTNLALLGLVAGLMASNVAAEPVAPTRVSDLKPLLLRAMEHGEAHGVLTGPAAEYVRRRFDATTPIDIDVRALHALPQAGCSRLAITTRQRDVLENTQRSDKALTFQISFCGDGHVPDKR